MLTLAAWVNIKNLFIFLFFFFNLLHFCNKCANQQSDNPG